MLLVCGFGEKWRRTAWPLVAAIAAVFLLRNYNAHHPWSAVCEIGLGLLFSLELLTASQPLAFPKWQRGATVATVAFTVMLAMSWMALDDSNNRSFNSLKSLVAKNTPRHAVIVMDGSLLPAGETPLPDFSERFDRRLVTPETWSHLTNGEEIFLLTRTNLPDGAALVAESHLAPATADRILFPLLDFYRTKISRRAGDREEYFGGYQLGKLPPPGQ